MLKVGMIDANTKKQEMDESYSELVSVVALWLRYELEKAGIALTTPARDADVVLLVHSGELDFVKNCHDALRQARINPDPNERTHYIITGGGIDTSPMTALAIANALAVGEAYRFVRELFELCKRTSHVGDVDAWVAAYPHAIARSQVLELERDPYQPYLFNSAPPVLATPDEWVDWGDLQPYLTDDGVYRVVASKGCHLRCQFCATTYRQTYRVNPDAESIVTMVRGLKAKKASVALITNDAAALPFYSDVVEAGQLQFQSMTVKALRDPHKRRDVMQTRMKMVRFGVEGLSARIRQAFGKPVSDDELLEILSEFRANKQQVKLFYIVGVPYEQDLDYDYMRAFLHRLQEQASSHTVTLKFTAFNPQFPTPLAYFIPPEHYTARFYAMRDAVLSRYHNRHIRFIPPRSPYRRLEALAETYAVSKGVMRTFVQDTTVDLAPTVDEARRMTCELVGWHLSPERRWRLSRSYQKQMAAEAPDALTTAPSIP